MQQAALRLVSPHFSVHPASQAVNRILEAALAAVEPGECVRRFLRMERGELSVDGATYRLKDFQRLILLAVGKAALPMAQAAAVVLGEHITSGLVITKEGHAPLPTGWPVEKLKVLEAGHPTPDQRSVQASQQVAQLFSSMRSNDLVIGLLSGGGSALLTSPAPGVSLQDLQTLTTLLLKCGASIHEINTLRKHLEQLKGGGLARLAAPARLAMLILSDVVGDALDVIASGPSAPDPSTFQQAWEILARYNLLDQAPKAVLERLQHGLDGRILETPKPAAPDFDNVHNTLVGSNQQAAQAALTQARREGFNTLLLTTALQGEARQAGRFLAAIARQVAVHDQPVARPACIIAGGETTVTVRGDGLGGRNLELALGAVADLDGLPATALVTLATDGGDGPTDAAGAIASGESASRARLSGLDPCKFLAENDSYHFFAALDDLLKSGATLTNVNDLAFIFAF